MTKQFDNEITDNETKNSWQQAAKGAAVVGGVFSVIVLSLLFVNYLQIKLLDPLRTERLENMKLQLLQQPKDEQLLSQIRELDLQNRKDKIKRLDFSKKGTLFLLISVIVFLVGVKTAKEFEKVPPAPGAPADQQMQQVRHSLLARWVLTAGSAFIAAAALLFISTSKIEFSQASISYPSDEEIAKNWASFRGPQGGGVSAYTNIPDKWDGKSGEGILWKSEIPLTGHNSPVVWEDKVFISGANKGKRQVYCFDADSGKLLWQVDVASTPSGNDSGLEIDSGTSYAAPTLATDGSRVCVLFPNGDVGCFDFEGKNIWTRNLGLPESIYGYASSLAIYQNLLLIQYDQGMADDGKSRMYALDTFSGMTVWEVKRDVSSSWTSPIVAKVGDQSQLITSGDPWVIAYNPLNGTELWRLDCLGTDVAPSPIYAGGLVFAIKPYSKLVAINPTGTGDVTETHITWEADDGGPDICSPVSNGELIFILESQGYIICYKVQDGTKLWEKDLEASFTASPSIVGENLYILSEKGVMIIAKAGSEYAELTKCELGENCYASPAFADGRIYIRANKNLYCIGN
ncbi:MAG: PQQ-like beta-propeller repeat protein [Planctomycetota bacterium]|jgi:outer membrane protein assembly factor BamB